MTRRLPPQPDEWIDREKRVSFRFEGRSYTGYAGDVITSALLAGGVRMVGRSFKYHRPRGVYSFANHDANAMFTDGGRTNIRGDVTPIKPSMDLRAVNTFGGLERDRMRITERFAKFMPVGFYYKAFFKPRWLFPFHERQMRKVAGLGRVNLDLPATNSPKDYAWCDLLVVGSGPSGLSAAIAAAECGAHVMLVDEQPRLGGSLNYQFKHDDPMREMIARAESLANITVRLSTMAGACYTDHWISLFDETRLTKLRARALLIAAGAIEQPAVFGNNDLPGVMLGSAAQRLIRQYAVKPFDRAVVLTANEQGYRAALDLARTGVRVMAVVDLRSDGEASQVADRVRQAGVRVLNGWMIHEGTPSADKTGISSVSLCRRNGSDVETIACDGVAMSVGWMPNGGLLYQSGARFTHDDAVGQLVPITMPQGVFAAGRVNGIHAPADRVRDGRRAGLAAAKYLNLYCDEVPDATAHQGPPHSHLYPVFEHPGGKNFVDLDEDLHLTDFVNAHQEGYDNVELLKRYTTVGMGPSQGKLANMNAVRILAKLNGRSINDTGTTTSRPFIHPAPLGHLAGRRFHPMRRTPMHDWHADHDAAFIHAGSWYRPEYYRRMGASREDRILAEAVHVRQQLGLIDLSTLGKLFICGRDAIEFLQRIYTGRFAKLAVGKQRYAVALDDGGIIIEDGVIARLAEDVFYVTATSSGAEGFYREMQRWALIWGLEVSIINGTGQYAAMNIAGPHSREALAELTDVDLSAEAFPYLGARQGRVADVRAILLRVGFVGELGYEVHVPASHGMHVWNAILKAGRKFDIEPFGVEAQRLLRLEKGHLIVSQDTDALTQPLEADLTWALGKNKEFFVGQRSIDVLQQHTPQRKLVGIRWPENYTGPLPLECHLIVDTVRNNIVGRVTSIAHRSTLGYPLGMAFMHPLAKPGAEVTVRVGDGTLSKATIVKLPHYDPENDRQNA